MPPILKSPEFLLIERIKASSVCYFLKKNRSMCVFSELFEQHPGDFPMFSKKLLFVLVCLLLFPILGALAWPIKAGEISKDPKIP